MTADEAAAARRQADVERDITVALMKPDSKILSLLPECSDDWWHDEIEKLYRAAANPMCDATTIGNRLRTMMNGAIAAAAAARIDFESRR